MNIYELELILKRIKNIDIESQKLAINELNRKMKPNKSLGILEDIAIKMSGIYGYPLKKDYKKCHLVAVSDNGIIEEGVSSCPISYTSLVSEAMLNKISAIGIFCNRLNIELNVIDVGMKYSIKNNYKNLYDRNILKGTYNFYKRPAMSKEDVLKAIKIGIDLIEEKNDIDIFSNGEMGIGNTTTSSAVLYSLTKHNLDEIVGRGGGLSDEALKRKKKIIKESCDKYNTFNMNIIDMLSHISGLDICTMIGMYIGCAKNNKMMLVDGFISSVAAYTAFKLEPKIKNYILFTHKTEEPGIKLILNLMKEKIFLNLNMRLGEGTGAIFAYSFIDCAVDMINIMKSPKEVYDLYWR